MCEQRRVAFSSSSELLGHFEAADANSGDLRTLFACRPRFPCLTIRIIELGLVEVRSLQLAERFNQRRARLPSPPPPGCNLDKKTTTMANSNSGRAQDNNQFSRMPPRRTKNSSQSAPTQLFGSGIRYSNRDQCAKQGLDIGIGIRIRIGALPGRCCSAPY